MSSNVRADLWSTRYWNTPGGRAVYWIKRAVKPGATYTAKQAAKCFWILACDALGEVAARREVDLAELAFPDDLLGGVYADYQVQRAKMEGADSTKRTHQRRQSQRISDATPRAA